jgi:hypothetical protein
MNYSMSEGGYDSDEELYEEEYEQNEIPPPGVEDEFRNAMLDAKKSLNFTIIDGPELETRNAQDIKLVNKYVNTLNKLYILSIDAQKGIDVVNVKNMDAFPADSREKVKIALNFITDYFKNLSVADRIPYENYIRNSFKENQFLLHNNFDE